MRIQAVVSLVLVVALHEMVVNGVSKKGNSTLTTHKKGRLPRNRTETTRRKARYKVNLQFPGSPLDQFLDDKGRARYQEMTRTLTEDIERLFTKTNGVQKVYNLQFRSYKRPQDEHDNLNKPSSRRNEIAIAPTSSVLQPESLVLLTSQKPQLSSSTVSLQQEDSEASTSSWSSTVADSSSPLLSTKQSPTKTSQQTDASTYTDAVVTTTDRTTLSTTRKRRTSYSTASTTATKKSRDSTFDVPLITRLFKECYVRPADSKDYQLLLEPYMDGYTELLSIFTIMGPIFHFAGDDARSKLVILRRLRREDIEMNQDNYATFQNMFAYEYSPQGAKADLEGVTSNKWIHRPLKLISGIIKSAMDSKSEKSLGSQVQEIYSEILAPHHAWYVRAAVTLALLSFPSRSSMIEKLGRTESPEDMQAFADLTSAIDAVYDEVESLYLKYSPIGSQ